MISNIGRYAEYLVLAELLRLNIEAYPAISFQQEDYDITVVLQDRFLARIQVKATELQNKSTNNAIGKVDKNFNFLALVVVDGDCNRFFILDKQEVEKISSKGQISISEKLSDRYVVKSSIVAHEGKWGKIINYAQLVETGKRENA